MTLRKKIARDRPKIPKPPSLGEETMAQHLRAHHLNFTREVQFCPDRKWRFDFLLKDYFPQVAIEVEGGHHKKSGHTSYYGYRKDCQKYNRAASMGFVVLRFTTDQVTSGEAIDTVLMALEGRSRMA